MNRPKAVGLPSRRRVVRIAAICFITLGVLVALAFQLYQSRIDQFFESMVAKTLLSTHESQIKEVQSVIRKVCGTLESVAAIYKSAAVSPESDWSVSYLQSISEWNNEFTVEYIPLSRLEPPAASTGQNADMRNRLLGGETVVSDVRFSHRTGARAFFSIEAPVEQNGTVIGVLLRGEKGEPLTLLGKLADIQKQKEKEQSLLKQSTLDAMTGVYNRTAIETQINRLLAENIPGFLLMIDLDNFKHVNDSLGHMAGDALLVQFVQALKDEFRKQDLIGRVGGDEFVVFMSGTANRNAASKKAAYLLQKIGTLSADSSVSASIGIAASPAHGRSYAALYTAAGKAMYYAKQKGENTMCFAPNTAE